jgi:hypothetical protein
VAVAECPMCRVVVPTDQLTYLMGRKMCRNCVASWFEDDEAESDEKSNS